MTGISVMTGYPLISLEEYRKCFLGYNILGCAVRSRDVLCFVAQEDYTQWPEEVDDGDEMELKKRFIPYIRTKPKGQQWSAAALTGFDGILVGYSPVPPKPQVIVSGVRGGVYATGSGESSLESIPLADENGPKRGAVLKLKTIGEHLYVCGNGRSVGRRMGRDRWIGFSHMIPEAARGVREGFDDIDGFAEDDVYAVGGEGDVWRFDGTRWRPCRFPSDLLLGCVCCAGDGHVYVGASMGTVFRGRGDDWTVIHEGNLSIPFKDMVWHEGEVWCTNDHGLWTIRDGALQEAAVGSDVKICSGNLSSRDGVLLLAGHGGAAFRQDGAWSVIFHTLLMPDDE